MPSDFFSQIVIFGSAGLFLLAAVVVWLVFRRRRRPASEFNEIVFVDVAALPAHGPPPSERQLTCYGVPVRVAAIVVAHSGRGRDVPADVVLRDVLEAAVPGLSEIARVHRPRVDRWPDQLSAHGFTNSFYAHLRLPGDHGKSTPWCSVAGRVEHRGQHYLLGIVCCADRPNSLGEMTIEHAGKWLDALRLRD